jgi:hypothetical protein
MALGVFEGRRRRRSDCAGILSRHGNKTFAVLINLCGIISIIQTVKREANSEDG